MKYILFLALAIWAPCVFAQDAISLEKTNWTVIEGTLSQVSKLPPAEENAYPDCYYTATMSIKQIISGQSIPKEISLVLPGFFSRQYAPESKYKTGDKIRAKVIPFASTPDKVRQTQQADEIEDVDLEFYFPEKINLIQDFQNIEAEVLFSGKAQKTEHGIKFQAIDLKAKDARQEQIKSDLEIINGLLAKHGGDWDSWYDSLKDLRSQYKQQYDAKAQRWIGNSFFTAGKNPDGKLYSPEFVKSIVAFKNYLSVRHVDLILVRVPHKGEIVDDLFLPVPSDHVSNPNLLRMYKELLEADVEIITDIVPRAKKERLKYPLMYWYQDFGEWHPAEGIAWVIGEEFAKRISRYSRVNLLKKNQFILKKASSREYKWPDGNTQFDPSEYVQFLVVQDGNGNPLGLKQGLDSPVLVLGSSFIVSPSRSQGGSIPQYLAYLTGVIPDILQRNEGDLMMPRSVAREGDVFLQSRSVCLFPFTPDMPYKALASLPIIDPDKSFKTSIVSYSGPAMREVINFSSNTPEGVFSYLNEGMLNIQPNKGMGAAGSFSVKVPEAVSKFPYFILDIEFISSDRAEVIARYSGQEDSIKRSEGQSKNNEVFAFASKSSNLIELEIKGSAWLIKPVTIKSIKFYGVTQPSYYKL